MNLRRTLFIAIAFFAMAFSAGAQNLDYARNTIRHLASGAFKGRGYAHQHDSLAAAFIAGEMQKMGVQAPSSGRFQHFRLHSNTFPGAMHLSFGDDTLKPGADYLVCSFSKGASGTFPLVPVKKGQDVDVHDTCRGFLAMDYHDFASKNQPNCSDLRYLYENYPQPVRIGEGPSGIIYLVDDLSYYTPSSIVADYTMIMMEKPRNLQGSDSINLNIEQEQLLGHQTSNVLGVIPGKTDSTILLTAHYDHLGMMGESTWFPGAHDNASGTAMLLDLAGHYAEEKPHYTLVFIFFSGEESGLKGSLHYTGHPVFPLESTRFVINLDLVGSGEAGITVVNGKTHPGALNQLRTINNEHQYLSSVKARGEAQNSDHWPFHKKGVPAFFIYTRGSYRAYHNIHDKAEGLPLSGYNGLFKLTTSFVKALEPGKEK